VYGALTEITSFALTYEI